MLQRLQQLPVAERNELKDKIKKQDERHNNFEDPSYDRSKNQVIVILTLTLHEGEEVKQKVLTALKELQSYAKSLASCLR